MRIMFDDDHGCRIVMECTSVCAMEDPEDPGWIVVASGDRDVIVRTGLEEKAAKSIVRKLFEIGSYVQCP